MGPLAIVKAGTTLASIAARRGDFEDWINAGLGLDPERVRVVRAFEGEELPDPRELAGVVVTGSSARVTDREPWSERTASWLQTVVEADTPLLAICYGHQLLAHGLGGRVVRNPLGREIGTVDVTLDGAARDDALLGGFSGGLRVQTTHVESVLELPPGATRLATTKLDPNHAFRIGSAAWGVQFHPEFDAEIVRGYLTERRDELCDEGIDVEALLRDAADGPDGASVLRRFSDLLRG